METALLDIAAHNLQNRTIALIENGSWAPTAGKLMRGILSKLKNVNILNETLTIKSSLKDDQLTALAEIADALVASMPKPRPIVNEGKQNPAALFKFQYGCSRSPPAKGTRTTPASSTPPSRWPISPSAFPSRSSRPTTPAA